MSRELIIEFPGEPPLNTMPKFKGELVRCKNCQYAPGNDKGYTCKVQSLLRDFMKDPDNFFCADGDKNNEKSEYL